LHADGSENHGIRKFVAKDFYAEIARGNIAKHLWQDAPAIEGLEIRFHSAFAAGASGNVAVSFCGEALLRFLLEQCNRDRNRRLSPGEALLVDLKLAIRPNGLRRRLRLSAHLCAGIILPGRGIECGGIFSDD